MKRTTTPSSERKEENRIVLITILIYGFCFLLTLYFKITIWLSGLASLYVLLISLLFLIKSRAWAYKALVVLLKPFEWLSNRIEHPQSKKIITSLLTIAAFLTVVLFIWLILSLIFRTNLILQFFAIYTVVVFASVLVTSKGFEDYINHRVYADKWIPYSSDLAKRYVSAFYFVFLILGEIVLLFHFDFGTKYITSRVLLPAFATYLAYEKGFR